MHLLLRYCKHMSGKMLLSVYYSSLSVDGAIQFAIHKLQKHFRRHPIPPVVTDAIFGKHSKEYNRGSFRKGPDIRQALLIHMFSKSQGGVREIR